jgi:hypothetical protein
MTAIKGVGSAVSADVAAQIATREALYADKGARSDSAQHAFHSNKVWIKLSSGANTLTDAEMETLDAQPATVEAGIGSSALAEANILGPVSKIPALPPGDGSDSLYRLGAKGFRPQPGITQATISSKGTYGALRETTVNFQVWSLEDLDSMERLYFRPGFSALLEWGHTAYFNTDKTFATFTERFPDFFTKQEEDGKPMPMVVEGKLEARRKAADYNYDGIFGYIKNFNWSFRADGGYDCSISIASIGSTIASVRSDVATPDVIPGGEMSKTDVNKFEEQLKSIFHYVFARLDQISGWTVGWGLRTKDQLLTTTVGGSSGSSGTGASGGTAGTSIFPTFLNNIQQNFIIYRKQIDEHPYFPTRRSIYYMPLSLVLETINKFIIPRTTLGPVFQIFDGTPDVVKAMGYTPISQYVTSNWHFSVNPYQVLLPKKAFIPGDLRGSIDAADHDKLGNVEGITNQIASRITGGRDQLGSDNTSILAIHLSSELLREVFDTAVSDDAKEGRDVLQLVKTLLERMNSLLGSVNEFDLHYDEKANTYIVVDRKNTPEDAVPEFKVTGLGTTVVSMNLVSKLSNKVAAQVSIAAQGASGNYKENVRELLRWNRFVVDRHTRLSLGPTVRDKPTIQESSAEWVRQAIMAYTVTGWGSSYEPSKIAELQSYHTTYCSKYVLDQYLREGKPEKGIIPVELQLTLLGISGLAVGQCFKISNGVLPTRYNSTFGFIITGLDHELKDRWYTTVKAQFYIIDPPGDTIKNGHTLPPARSRPSGPSGGGGGGGGGGPVPDPPVFTPNGDYLRGVIAELGYTDLGNLTRIADLTFEMSRYAAALFRRIKATYPTLKVTVSTGNGIHHWTNAPNSRHTKGRAIDFSISPTGPGVWKDPTQPFTLCDEISKNVIENFMWTTGGLASYIDEYNEPSRGATGPHFHISWLGRGDGTQDNTENARWHAVKAKGPAPLTLHPDYFLPSP